MQWSILESKWEGRRERKWEKGSASSSSVFAKAVQILKHYICYFHFISLWLYFLTQKWGLGVEIALHFFPTLKLCDWLFFQKIFPKLSGKLTKETQSIIFKIEISVQSTFWKFSDCQSTLFSKAPLCLKIKSYEDEISSKVSQN